VTTWKEREEVNKKKKKEEKRSTQRQRGGGGEVNPGVVPRELLFVLVWQEFMNLFGSIPVKKSVKDK
jgi:hypothetical protein